MYGVEAATGLGGIAAQVPGGDRYLPATLAMARGGRILAGQGPGSLPYGLDAGGRVGQAVSITGTSVDTPPAQQAGGWRQILDWHSSPAPWILLLLLVHHAWSSAAIRRR
jgi:hypothetical protein